MTDNSKPLENGKTRPSSEARQQAENGQGRKALPTSDRTQAPPDLKSSESLLWCTADRMRDHIHAAIDLAVQLAEIVAQRENPHKDAAVLLCSAAWKSRGMGGAVLLHHLKTGELEVVLPGLKGEVKLTFRES